MKVLYLSTSCGVGGASIQIRRMCEYMVNEGNNVVFISMVHAFSDEMENSIKNMGVTYYSLDMNRGKIRLKDIRKLIGILRVENADIIHSHMVHANLMARIASLFVKKRKLINTVHGEEEYLGVRKLLYRYTNFLCDEIVCVGNVLMDEAIKKRIFPASKVQVIYNGLNISNYKKNVDERLCLREKYNISDDEFVWITVGRMEPVKNYRYLLQEFKRVSILDKKAKLVIVGYGSEEKRLKEYVSDNNLDDVVYFTGKQENVAAYLSMADAFVLSSIHEGLPLSLQEAGAASLPMVVTNVGGCGEVVEDSVNGFICKENNSGDLASLMRKMMSLDSAKYAEMSNASFVKVCKMFEIKNTMRGWCKLYE